MGLGFDARYIGSPPPQSSRSTAKLVEAGGISFKSVADRVKDLAVDLRRNGVESALEAFDVKAVTNELPDNIATKILSSAAESIPCT